MTSLSRHPLRPPFAPSLLAASCLLASTLSHAATFVVGTEAELQQSILAVNAAPGPHFIEFSSSITLTGPLPPILNDLTIKGNDHKLDGNDQTRLLFIGSSGELDAPRILVKLTDLELVNGKAVGGSGGAGAGGGLGAGGALFVNSQADVVLNNVSMEGNAALGGQGVSGAGGGGGGIGGNGGTGPGGGGGGLQGEGGGNTGGGSGGGGGLQGAGGNGSAAGAGGGGGFTGAGGDTASAGQNGSALFWQSGSGGNGAGGAAGGSQGGGGGGDAASAGGGGFGGGNGAAGAAGDGGFGGGGGALAGAGAAGDGGFGGGGGGAVGTGAGGKGGFGGGGGGAENGAAGNGGFGGGGGSSVTGAGGNGGFGGGGGAGTTPGAAGLGGGAGSTVAGGGGAGLGGAIFVAQGGTIAVDGDISLSDGSVAGGGGANSGKAAGAGLFLQGSGTLTLKVNNEKNVVIEDGIADSVGAGIATSNFQRWNLNISGGGPVPVDSDDPTQGNTYGLVVLSGNNQYSGNTFVSGADLAIGSMQNLGTGNGVVALDDGGLFLGANMDMTRDITLGSAGGRIGASSSGATLSGDITGAGRMTKVGNGELKLAGDTLLTSGTWEVFEGRLRLDSNARLGGNNIGLVLNGGGITYENDFALRNFTVASRGGYITNGANADIHLNSIVTGQGTITFESDATHTIFVDTQLLNTGGTHVKSGKVQGAIGGGDLTVDLGGTYILGGADRQLAKLAGEGNIELGSNTLTSTIYGLPNAAESSMFEGVISGTGGLVMLGNKDGMLRLEGNNTYTGGTRINGGVLSIAADANVNGGNSTTAYDVRLENDGILRFDNMGLAITSDLDIDISNRGGIETTADLTLTGNITGSNVDLKKIGSGTLTLDNANTYSGTTTVEGGGSLIALANAQGLGDSRLILKDDGGLKLLTNTSSLRELELAGGNGVIDTNGFDAVVTQAMSGAGNLVKQGDGTMTLQADSLFTGTTEIRRGVLQVGDGGSTGSLSNNGVSIGNDAKLVLNRAGNLVMSGDISGNGRVEIVGPGTVTLTPGSANTFLGGLLVTDGLVAAASEKALGFGDVTLNGGGLQLLGDINRDVEIGAAGATLSVGGIDSFQLKGDLTGSGDFTKTGTGTLVYTGVAGHTGGSTTVAAGTLRIGSGLSGALVGDVDVNGGATLVFGRDDLTLYQGVIDGSGTVIKLGAGELVLTGEQLFNGVFDVQAGNLRIGYGGTAGSLSGDVALASGSRLVFDRSDNSLFSGATTGAGALTKNGAGSLTLTGNLAHGGGTLLNSGRLVLGNYDAAIAGSGLSGSLAGDVSLGGSTELVFNRRDDMTIAGAISGDGKLVQTGLGTTTLTGNNTHTGGVIVENGHLAVDSDARLGDSSGKLILRNGGVLRYLANFSLRDITLEPSGGGLDTNGFNINYTGLVSGSGNFIKEGLGRLTVTRMLLEGKLLVKDGEMRIGDGTDTADSVATLGDADIARFTDGGGTLHVANLTLNRNGLMNFEGVLTGSGDLHQIGSGELRLPGDSSGFSGNTYIDRGSLRLNGRLGGDLHLASGAAMQGTGTLLGNLSSTGGTIKPGNSIGTLTVGSLTLDAASTLEMEMNASGATDRINVGGAAALAGTLHLLPQPGDYTAAGCCTYTIINAGSVSGTFNTVTNDLVFLNATVDYQPTAVNVSFNRNATAFSTVSLTYNQQQVSSALDVMEAQDPSNPVVELITPLTATQARDAYDVLSGDSLLNTVNASARSARRFNHLLSARSSRLGQASRGGSPESMDKSLSAVRGGRMPEAPQAFTQSLDPLHYDGPTSMVEGLWLEANAFRSSEDSDEVVGSAASSFDGNLLALGVDGYWSNNLILGFGAGYLQGTMAYDNRQGDGDATGSFVGTYGRWETDSGWHYKAALTLGQQSTDQTRSGSIGGSSAKAVSSVDVASATAEFEAGLALHVGNYGLRPYVLVDTQYLKRDAINESGAGAADLQVDAANDVLGEFGVGAEISRPWLTDGARWAQLQAGLALLQPFGDTQRQQTVRFSGMSNSYTVKATADDSAALQLTVGGEWYFSRSVALWGGYEGRISSSTQEHNGVISIQYRW